MSKATVEATPRYHTLTITVEGLELAALKELIRNVRSDLATLEAELARRQARITPGHE